MSHWFIAVVAGYLALGVLAVLIGPLARAYRDELKPPTGLAATLRAAQGYPPIPRWKTWAMAATLAFGAVALWPVFLVSTWRAERTKSRDTTAADGLRPGRPLDDGRLYFSIIPGAGSVTCNRCGHTEDIIGFLHSFGDSWSQTGLQCQTCGRFGSLETLEDGSPAKHFCTCPGEPTRDDPLFCPACRSPDVAYSMSYMT